MTYLLKPNKLSFVPAGVFGEARNTKVPGLSDLKLGLLPTAMEKVSHLALGVGWPEFDLCRETHPN